MADQRTAHLMVTRANGPIPAGEQAVLFYLYAPDLAAYRTELEAQEIKAGTITYPFYMPGSEFRIEDPDGYVLLVGQADSL